MQIEIYVINIANVDMVLRLYPRKSPVFAHACRADIQRKITECQPYMSDVQL